MNAQGKEKSRILEALGPIALAALLLGPLLAWLRFLPALIGFSLFALGGIIGTLLLIWSLLRGFRGRPLGLGAAVGLLSGLVFLFNAFSTPRGPTINDFSTDLLDPPVFIAAAEAPANLGLNLSYDPAFAELQRACCPDLETIELPDTTPTATLERAAEIVRTMPGWTLVAIDPAQHRLEAVAETPLFGFRDDVVIRVRSAGAESQIDMRSKSRDGRSDLGANAARIRAFRERILATAPAMPPAD